jgi:hypothetical protein
LWEAGLLAFLTVILLVQISDNDIWYHLSIGREIFNSSTIPGHEFLVFPNADKPGSYHEWGFGLLHFLAYHFSGYWGMSIVNALMASLTLFLLYKAAGADKGEEPWFFVAILLIVVWTEWRFIYRPEMVLYLVLAAEILLLERFLPNRDWKWLVPIPLMAFVLNQAHPSVIFVVAILGGYALQILWESRRNLRSARAPLTWMSLAGAGAVLLGVVNPYGMDQVILPFKFLAAGRATMFIEEFQNIHVAGYHWSYFSLLVVSVLGLAVSRNRRLVDWLFFIVFAVFAFRYVRNIALFALVMYVPMARGWADGVRRLVSKLKERGVDVKDRSLGVAAWSCALLALLAVLFTPVVIRPWGAGPVPTMFPETAAAAIKEIKPPGRIFNYYDMGGFLGWALGGQYQVFIDGRHYDANRALSVHNAVINGRPGWQRPLEQYDVNTIAVQATFKNSGGLLPIIDILANDPEWSLVARGERALLFMRKEIAHDLPQRFRLNKSEVWEQVIIEADYVLGYFPFSPGALMSRAEALLALGHESLAIREFESYLRMVPGDVETAERLRKLKDNSDSESG